MQKVEKKHFTSPWITLAILSGLGIVAMSSETMVLPAIPEIIVDLGISYEDSSWILAAPSGHGSSYDSDCRQVVRYLRQKENTADNFWDFYIRLFDRSFYNQFSYLLLLLG